MIKATVVFDVPAADAAADALCIDSLSGDHLGDDAAAVADYQRGVADWQAEHGTVAS